MDEFFLLLPYETFHFFYSVWSVGKTTFLLDSQLSQGQLCLDFGYEMKHQMCTYKRRLEARNVLENVREINTC